MMQGLHILHDTGVEFGCLGVLFGFLGVAQSHKGLTKL